MKVVVVVPTYNERDNIGKLLPALSEFDVDVLVVDSNSPDGTASVVKEFAASHGRVHLLQEAGKSGLGGAYILGMRHAMNELSADVVCEMDADLQHKPSDLPRLLEPIMSGRADVAVGSRFVPGGSIPREWAFYRKFLSYFGNFYGRIMMGMWRYHDVTSGFRATRATFLSRINLEELLSRSFAYKMDLYYRLHSLGARIVEVPIRFDYRQEGTSKQEMHLVSRNDFLDSLRVVGQIFIHRILH